MSFEVMLVALAGIGAFVWFINRAMRHEELKLRVQKDGSEEAAQLAAVSVRTEKQLAQLRERVAVLEKLATDDDRRLSAEIGRLGSSDPAVAR